MFKNKKKLFYRVAAAAWIVFGILSIAGGSYWYALLMFIMAVVSFLLSNRTGNGSTSESYEEEQE